MENFEKILLRLKQHLCVQTDKEVAEALGLSVKAFTARKMRDSFPTDKLLALKARRPELYIDDHYVLTGEPGPDSSAAKAIAGTLNAVRTKLGNYSVGEPSLGYPPQVDVLMGKIRMLDREDLVAVESVVDAILKNKRIDS